MQNEIEKPISNSISHTSMPFASIDKNNPIEENMKNFFEGKNIVSITNLNDQNEVVQNHNQDNLIKKLEIRFENNFTKIYDVEFFKTENNLVEYKIKTIIMNFYILLSLSKWKFSSIRFRWFIHA